MLGDKLKRLSVLSLANRGLGNNTDFYDKKNPTYGLKTLYEGSDCIVDVVFVHGLTSDRTRPWSVPNSSRPWPQTLLPSRVSKARILTFEYDADVVSWNELLSNNHIGNHARDLLNAVASHRQHDDTNGRPLIFVCHSLGGLICEDALQTAHQRSEEHIQSMVRATQGIILLGVPHQSAGLAEWAEKIALSLGILKDPTPRIREKLKKESEVVTRLQNAFQTMLRSRVQDGLQPIEVACFYEGTPLADIGIVVGEESAHPPDYKSIALHQNHIDMAKFRSVDDPGYMKVTAELRRWIKQMNISHGQSVSKQPNLLKQTELFRGLMRSLADADARDHQNDGSNAYSSTYQWVYEDRNDFRRWLRDPNSRNLFWIKGKPGTGKSTLMKFILNNPATHQILQDLHPGRWIKAGFFFHDRGLINQKSFTALLREMLYQILLARDDLLPIAARVFLEKLVTRPIQESGASWTISDVDNAFENIDQLHNVRWDADDLRRILDLINTHAAATVNVCFFINGLDEYEGNLREIAETLMALVDPGGSAQLRVKLVIASQPRTVFREIFSTCPGFSIRDHTVQDIKAYANRRLQKTYVDKLSMSEDLEFAELLDQIIDKAKGVFVWLRLVLDEIIMGLEEGDNIADLRDLFASLPSDLNDLYHRAFIRGGDRSLGHTSDARQRREAYIMLQIRSCAEADSFTVQELIKATTFLCTFNPEKGESFSIVPDMNLGDMKRRVSARCQGLLEVVSSGSRHSGPYVQFVHQTAREFALRDWRLKAFLDPKDPLREENGHVLLARYHIYKIRCGSESHIEHLRYHSLQAERSTGKAWAADLRCLLQGENGAYGQIVAMMLRNLELSTLSRKAIDGIKNPRFWLMSVAVAFNLVHYLQYEISETQEKIRDHAARLLAAIFWAPTNDTYLPTVGFERVVQQILEISDVMTTFSDNKALGNLLIRNFYEITKAEVERNNDASLLRILLSHGEDPNCKIILPSTRSEQNGTSKTSSSTMTTTPLVAITENPTNKLTFATGPSFVHMEILMDFGADPAGTDNNGNTALFYAIYQNDKLKVQQLVLAGADPAKLNSSGLNFWLLSEKNFKGTRYGSFEAYLAKCEAMRPIITACAGRRRVRASRAASTSATNGTSGPQRMIRHSVGSLRNRFSWALQSPIE